MDTHPALLPNGLMDLLPDDAEAEAQAIYTLMQAFSAFGYRRVKPPLVEFEDSLLAPGPGQAVARNTFRLMDPVSQRMMGVRADTTAQIARIASSRLAKDKRPLRLSYAADVLRVNGTQLRPARQFCQVGCELIGADGGAADSEVMLLALKGLTEIGLKDLSIDLTAPSLVGSVFDAAKTPEKTRNEISAILKRRDREALAKIDDKSVTTLLQLLDGVGAAQASLEKISTSDLPEIKTLSEAYENLTEGLGAYGLKDINITIDPLEHRGLDYETGVSFTLFAAGVRGELGGGGRYRLTHGKADETATGFTLYMDSILPALPKMAMAPTETVDLKAKWQEIRDLQKKGKIVFRA